MLFNSYVFLLLFLPVIWCAYFALNHIRLYRISQAVLIAGSFFFYGYQEPRLCLILLSSIGVNYALHILLADTAAEKRLKDVLLVLGIAANFGLLLYFKYYNFLLENVNRLLHTEFVLKAIVLPLGISFFTFQQVSFLVDSRRGEIKRCRFLDYALFVAFFPQLVAGPIVLHREMIPQFQDLKRRRPDYGNITAGLEYLVIGLAKKVLVADSFARICDAGYESLGSLNSFSACLTILAFTLEIYFDFSGYCDMAVGLGRLFNIHIPVNFHSPYKALTIADFWKRWHMTLTRFLTTYLYIPLGGNRGGTWRTYRNVMIVFALSGLWHGADWNYVLWGILHGTALVIYRMGRRYFDRLPRWLLWTGTFSFVNIAWIFFRADYFRQPLRLLSRVMTGGSGLCQAAMVDALCRDTVWMTLLERFMDAGTLQTAGQAAVAGWFLLWTAVCVVLPSSHEIVARRIRSTWYYLALGALLSWSFMWLSQMSKFIYFNF